MRPGIIPGYTRVLGAPPDWDQSKAECLGLPIRESEQDGIPLMESLWKPTLRELDDMANGAALILTVAGKGHPAVSIHVTETPA